MNYRRPLLAALAVVILAAQPLAAAPKWLRLDSRSFVVVGAASESTLRNIASHLEQFRDVFGRVLPQNRGLAALPTVVIVFSDERSQKPFWPEVNGRPVVSAGLFVRGPDVNYVSLNTQHGEYVYRIVFHEYTHFITSNVLAVPPLWLNEGLAEYNSTFEATRSGDRADVGRLIDEHVQLLRRSRLLPIAELLTVDQTSSLYNEEDRRTVFYAESWALVHYLAIGNPARQGQLSKFVNRIIAGAPQIQAFREAFACEPPQLDTELSAYVQQQVFRRVVVRLKEPIAVERIGTVTPVSDREAEAYLGDLLARMGRSADARARLDAVLEADPNVARAHAALGLLDLREGDPDAAVTHLKQAVALNGNDAGFQYGLGTALLRSARAHAFGLDPALIGQARAALTRATELHPDFADAVANLGLVCLLEGNAEQGRALIERASRLVPSRPDYLFFLAQAHAQAGNIPAARAMLTKLQSASPSEVIRAAAKEQLDELVQREKEPRMGTSAPTVAETANDLNRQGLQAYDAGRYEEARDLFTRATEKDPKQPWAWNNLGRALTRLGQGEEAIAAFERQVAVSPRDEYAHDNLGSALWRAGRLDAAEREYLVHLEIRPDDERVLLQLVQLQVGQRHEDAALATLEKAAARPSTRAVVFLRMAWLARSLGREQAARTAIAGALERQPGPADLAEAAIFEREGGKAHAAKAVEEAVRQLQQLKLAEAGTAYRPLVYALGLSWTALGQLACVRKNLVACDEHLRAAWALTPHPMTASLLGQLELSRGARRPALEWLARAAAYGPGGEQATSRLGELVGVAAKRDALLKDARAKWTALPTVPVPALASPSGSATAEVLLSIDGKGRVEACHVVRADQGLADVAASLLGLVVWTPAAGHDVARLIREARVTCTPGSPCRLALQPVLAPGDTPLFLR